MRDLKVGPLIAIGNITIIPIEEVKIYNSPFKRLASLYALKEPFAIIISEEKRTTVFGIGEQELSLDSLIDEVAGLEEILND